jgi:hypothetical protein
VPAPAHERDHRDGHRQPHEPEHDRRRVLGELHEARAGGGEQGCGGQGEDDHAEHHRDEHLQVVAQEVPVDDAQGHKVPPKRRSRSALMTTETLESAMARPATSGLSRPAAASGSAATS